MTGVRVQVVHAAAASMKTAFIACVAAICFLFSAGNARADVLWSFVETPGGDVVGTFSGSLDLTNAVFFSAIITGPPVLCPCPNVDPLHAAAFNDTVTAGNAYTLSSSPTNFGPGMPVGFPAIILPSPADSAIGSQFGVTQSWVMVPTTYNSNDPLSGTMTFLGETFASLGIDPGTYVYSLLVDQGGILGLNGQGELTGDTVTLQFGPSEIPLPGALPLFATGLGALGLLGWRRKRKQAAAAVA